MDALPLIHTGCVRTHVHRRTHSRAHTHTCTQRLQCTKMCFKQTYGRVHTVSSGSRPCITMIMDGSNHSHAELCIRGLIPVPNAPFAFTGAKGPRSARCGNRVRPFGWRVRVVAFHPNSICVVTLPQWSKPRKPQTSTESNPKQTFSIKRRISQWLQNQHILQVWISNQNCNSLLPLSIP